MRFFRSYFNLFYDSVVSIFTNKWDFAIFCMFLVIMSLHLSRKAVRVFQEVSPAKHMCRLHVLLDKVNILRKFDFANRFQESFFQDILKYMIVKYS